MGGAPLKCPREDIFSTKNKQKWQIPYLERCYNVYAFPLVKLPHSECITETIEYTRDDHKRDDDETNERVLFFFSWSFRTFFASFTSSATES